jgi:hypothetical protein
VTAEKDSGTLRSKALKMMPENAPAGHINRSVGLIEK